jgi:hypothetical protein
MSKEQTAIDWLINAIEANMDDIPFEVKQQAKSMEKEQIMNCCIQTTQDCYIAIMKYLNAPLEFTDKDLSNQKLEAEQYYNKKYRGDTIQNNMDNKQTDHNGQPLTYWGGLAENKETIGKDKFKKFLDVEMELGISDKKTIERIRWYYEEFFKDTIFYEQ